MAINLQPLTWHWEPVPKGDTYPAAIITETLSDADLVRVKIEIKANGNTTSSLVLDSDDDGIVITNSAAGAWAFTIEEISATTTDSLDEQYYAYQLKTTDANGVVRTEFQGTWEVTPQIPV